MADPQKRKIDPDQIVHDRNAVLRAIRSVRKRCNLNAGIIALSRWLFWGLLSALVVDVGLKVFGIGGWSWILVGGGSALGLAAAAFEFNRRRITQQMAAIRADEVLRLKERLSSALELSIEHAPGNQEEEAWDTLLLASASHAVDGLHVRHHFPLALTREGRWLWCPLAFVLISALFMPALDLWTGGGPEAYANLTMIPKEELSAETLELAELAEQMRLEQNEKKEKVTETSKMVNEIDDLANEMRTGKMEKRDAMAKLADLSNRIKERRDALGNSPQSSNMKMLMKPQEMSYMGDTSELLESQEFDEAAKALSRIEDRLNSGNLSESQLEQLSKEMNALAAQLDPNSNLAKALSKAANALKSGSPSAAKMNLQTAQLSLMDMQDLKKQMAMLDRASQAVAKCQLKMAGKPGTCSKCGSGSCPGAKGGMCKGMGKNGPWSAGDPNKIGNGLGGPGIGRGGKAPFTADDVTLEDSVLKGQMGEGQILGTFLVDGPPEEAEAMMQFSSVLEVARQRGEEAMEKEVVPIAYRQRVRQYFYSLNNSEQESSTDSDSEEAGS